MKVLLDTNVLMDVLQKREPHYEAPAKLLTLATEKRVHGIVPGHAPTTIYYLLCRYKQRQLADEIVDWLLATFDIAAATRETYLLARRSGIADFEDAAVAAMAERESCDYIVTRNTRDFANSKIACITPIQMLQDFS